MSIRRALMGLPGLFMLLALTARAVLAQGYNETGPYSVSSYKTTAKFSLPSYTRVEVDVKVTYPNDNAGPFPLIIMFNGFQCKASWYAETVDHVASWGYVVFQYTVGLISGLTVAEREEVKYLTPLLAWLETEVASKPALAGRVDFSRKAVMGHSRGGKLAGLHYASRDDLTTAIFLDPVDCGVNGNDRPSAIAKLVGLDIACGKKIPDHGRSDKTAAIIGAGFVKPWMSCNPEGTNYQTFFDTLSDKSWNILVKEAGHMQFAQSGDLAYFAIDATCGHGDIAHQAVILEAKTMAAAWFESVFRPSQSTQARLAAYKRQLEAQAAEGLLTFRMPPSDETESQRCKANCAASATV